MARAKRIFIVADFKDDSPKSIRMQPQMWVKGLMRLGHDVQRFSYLSIMTRCNPLSGIRSKPFAFDFVRRRADRILSDQIRSYSPDIILILSMKYISEQTVSIMRSAAPGVVIVGRDDDPFPDRNPVRLAIARQCDWVLTSSAGRFMKIYKDVGVPKCAFVPNLCDPDLQYRYDVADKWKTDIIFTGKAEHSRLDRNNERYEIVRRLAKMPNVRLYGCFDHPMVDGLDLFHAISGAKIGMSINIANDVKLYHSDRLINYLSCGTFVLARRVPDSDLLFADGVHLKYFDSADEFFELSRWYLEHEQEREKIALAGMNRAHSEFNCVKMTKYMLELVETGTYKVPWGQIL
jgi:spore maturation protein CgeB